MSLFESTITGNILNDGQTARSAALRRPAGHRADGLHATDGHRGQHRLHSGQRRGCGQQRGRRDGAAGGRAVPAAGPRALRPGRNDLAASEGLSSQPVQSHSSVAAFLKFRCGMKDVMLRTFI